MTLGNTSVIIHAENSELPVVLVNECSFKLYFLHSVIEQLNGKQLVMQLLGHDDPNVRYEALLAVQKLMVHNWEYLGKQLEKDTEKGLGASAIAAKS